MSHKSSVEALENLGLTRVEAEVYVHLVHQSPATGYRIAKAIDRTEGATYKVLASLASKGAVEAGSGKARLWRAVPPEEFLSQVKERFLEGTRHAEEALGKLEPPPPDYNIYQLKTVRQVYERAKTMLATCEYQAYIDIYPDPLGVLGKQLRAAVKRGVRLTMLVYETVKLPGALVVRTCDDHPAPDRFPVRWLGLAKDGRECLVAAIEREEDRVLEAFWSASPFFAWVFSGYVSVGVLGENVGALMEAGASIEDIRRSYRAYFKHNVPFSSPGFADLLERFGLG